MSNLIKRPKSQQSGRLIGAAPGECTVYVPNAASLSNFELAAAVIRALHAVHRNELIKQLGYSRDEAETYIQYIATSPKTFTRLNTDLVVVAFQPPPDGTLDHDLQRQIFSSVRGRFSARRKKQKPSKSY